MFKIKRPTIVVVCSANITRSPFFAGYLEKLVRQRPIPGLSDLEIISAGTRTNEGTPANPVIRHLAQLNGFSLSQHRSQAFKRKLARKADLVLTMENSQKDDLLKRYPRLEGCVFNVLNFGRPETGLPVKGIEDPTRGELDDFKEFQDVARREAERILHVLWDEGLP